jgi:hypothetical protein
MAGIDWAYALSLAASIALAVSAIYIPTVRDALAGIQRVLFSARQRLGLALRSRAANQVRPQPAPSDVIPIEISRRPIVGKTDFEAAAQRHGLVWNDADAVGHAALKRGRRRSANRQSLGDRSGRELLREGGPMSVTAKFAFLDRRARNRRHAQFPKVA